LLKLPLNFACPGDEDEQYSPFQGLEKAVVMQSTRIFSDAEV
jgi:hypothetical protein